jgi:hypothetical protein
MVHSVMIDPDIESDRTFLRSLPSISFRTHIYKWTQRLEDDVGPPVTRMTISLLRLTTIP